MTVTPGSLELGIERGTIVAVTWYHEHFNWMWKFFFFGVAGKLVILLEICLLYMYEGIPWTKLTTYSVLQNFDQWRRVKRSEGE